MNSKRQLLAVVAVMLVAGAPGAVGVAWGQCATELKKITASDAAAGDIFGWSVSISGDTTIVGAYLEDAVGTDSGSAYVFQGDAGGLDNWGQVKKLIASDAAAADMFGLAVSLSGDTAIVGARQNSDVGFFSGSAYIFQRDAGGLDNWGQVKKLTASDAAAEDEFGDSVWVGGDTAIVGAYLAGGSDSGSAYIFQRDAGGPGNWGQVAKLTASDAAAGDIFGKSVSLSGDTAIIGARMDDDGGADSGSAYIFQRDFGGLDNWGQVGKLTALDASAGDWFGWSVSMSADLAVVGAAHDSDVGPITGSAYVFERNAGGPNAWGQVAKLTASDAQQFALFGNSVAVAGDVVVVGAFEDDVNALAGSAYVFKRPPTGWDSIPSPINETAKLTADDAAQGDMFGSSVSISGNVVVIGVAHDDGGSSNSGSAYLYNLPNG